MHREAQERNRRNWIELEEIRGFNSVIKQTSHYRSVFAKVEDY